MSTESDLRKFGNAYDQFGDRCTIVPQDLLLRAADEIAEFRAIRLKLDRRIHNQRAANRDNWQIVEMRRKWLGSDTARRLYINLRIRYNALRDAGPSVAKEEK